MLVKTNGLISDMLEKQQTLMTQMHVIYLRLDRLDVVIREMPKTLKSQLDREEMGLLPKLSKLAVSQVSKSEIKQSPCASEEKEK